MSYALPRSVKPFFVAWFIFFLIVGFIGFGIARRGASVDFQSFYAAGYQLRTHPSQMYDLARQQEAQHAVTPGSGFIAFYHPSYETLLFALFSFLDYRSAYLCFIALNMLLLIAAFFAVQPAFVELDPAWQSRSAVILFLFIPLLAVFAQGQDSLLSLLLYCLAWRQLRSGRDRSAGCLLALALFKFQFAIPIAILVAIRRGWRFSAGFLISCSGLFLLSVCIVGRTGAVDYVHLLTGAVSTVDKSVLAQKLALDPRTMQNIAGLIYACGGRFLPSSLAFNALSGICALGIFAWCARAVRRVEHKAAFAIAMLCGLLVSYHFCFYDLALLLLPLALLAGRIHKSILITLFILPAIVMGLGWNWGFLMAVPMLAMLAYAIVTGSKSSTLAPAVHAASA